MKQNAYLLRTLILVLCFAVTATACSQEVKRSKIQSSANTKETVYKPQEKIEKVAAEKKAKATVQKKASAKKEKKTTQTAAAKKVKKAKATVTEVKGTSHEQGTVKQKKTTTQKKKAAAQKAKAGAKTKKTEIKAKGGVKAKSAAKRTKAGTKTKSETPSSRYIALKTNVPFLAVAVQNLALEVEVQKHISVDLPVMWSIGDIERKHGLRTIALQPEGRWWLKSVGTGHFFGLHAHAAWFNLKWDDNRYQTGKRPLLGAGISYGYKLPLSDHWGAEFNIGAGYANMKYDTFYNIENGAQLDTRVRHYWGITRAGISLVYRF